MAYLRIHRRVFSAFALSKTLCFSFFQELTPETFMWIEPEQIFCSVKAFRYCREDAPPKFRLKFQKSKPKVISPILKATKSKCQNPKDLCTRLVMTYRADVTFLLDWYHSLCLAVNVKNKEKLICFPFSLCMSAFQVLFIFICNSYTVICTLPICQRYTFVTVKLHTEWLSGWFTENLTLNCVLSGHWRMNPTDSSKGKRGFVFQWA